MIKKEWTKDWKKADADTLRLTIKRTDGGGDFDTDGSFRFVCRYSIPTDDVTDDTDDGVVFIKTSTDGEISLEVIDNLTVLFSITIKTADTKDVPLVGALSRDLYCELEQIREDGEPITISGGVIKLGYQIAVGT